MSKPLRLLVLTYEFEPHIIGGLGTAVTNLTKEYVNSGNKCIVISHSIHPKPTHIQNISLHLIHLPLIPSFYSMNTRQFKITPWLKRQVPHKPDSIHIHSPQFIQIAKYYQKKHRVPIIYTCHSLVALELGAKPVVKEKAIQQQIKLLRLADRIVVPSHWEFEMLKKLYPFCTTKTVIIQHGVTRRMPVNRGPSNHLLFIGRFDPIKGIEHLLEAIALLKKAGYHLKLDLVGKGSPRYVKKLKAMVKSLGIDSEVRWIGFRTQEEIQQLYASYGALVMPSIHESFGLVALEALASGIPLISTTSGGLAEFVNNRVAQTIPKVEGTAIAKAIVSVWNNSLLVHERVIAGRKLAAQYQWSNVAKKHLNIFMQYINKQKNREAI